MKLTLTPQRWDMVAPFVTAGETVNHIDVLHVMLEHEGLEGRAETMGVDYFGETVASLQAELSALDPLAIEQLDREAVHTLPARRQPQWSRLRAVFAGQTDRRWDQRADRYHPDATEHAVYLVT